MCALRRKFLNIKVFRGSLKNKPMNFINPKLVEEKVETNKRRDE